MFHSIRGIVLSRPMRSLLSLAVALSFPGTLGGGEPERARIAITIDDLPWNGPVPTEGLAAATARLLSTLARHDAPAAGFVNCGRLSAREDELLPWLDHAVTLGNHSAGHRDLNNAPLEVWLDDVRNCDADLRKIIGDPVRYFRYPMLHQGPTTGRRDAAKELLDELSYQVAQVTVDNSEYMLSRPYDAALQAGDDAEGRRLGELLIEHILAATRHAQEVACRKLGRSINHILLLHASLLVADNLDALLGALEVEGFELISLEEALRDPVYQRPDAYLGRKGLSWLYRIAPLSDTDAAWDDEEAERLRVRLEAP